MGAWGCFPRRLPSVLAQAEANGQSTTGLEDEVHLQQQLVVGLELHAEVAEENGEDELHLHHGQGLPDAIASAQGEGEVGGWGRLEG